MEDYRNFSINFWILAFNGHMDEIAAGGSDHSDLAAERLTFMMFYF